jgi:hypothetical protein
VIAAAGRHRDDRRYPKKIAIREKLWQMASVRTGLELAAGEPSRKAPKVIRACAVPRML